MLLMMSFFIYCLNMEVVDCGCLLYAYSNKYNRQKQQNICCRIYVLSQVIFVFFCFGYANVANEVETKEK